MQVETAILIIFGIWLISLTYLFLSTTKFLKRLSGDTKDGSFRATLEKIIETQGVSSKRIENLGNELKRIENEGTFHIQKVGLVRFNPFKDLGGDHSFCLAILDAGDTGVTITGLHSRDRTRIYMNAINHGKGEHELSHEEKRAITKAQRS